MFLALLLAVPGGFFNQDTFLRFALKPTRIELLVLVDSPALPTYVWEGPALECFPVVEKATLKPEDVQILFAVLSDPSSYDVPYPPPPLPTPSSDREVVGGVIGGMPSCLGYDLAIRFTEAHRVLECFVCLHCHSLTPANAEAEALNTRLSFSDAGVDRLRALFCTVLNHTEGACLVGY